MHLTPAGLPLGIPGKEEEIDNAIQQAPQFERQSINVIKGIKAQRRMGATAQR
jgi:hypothetical protein